MAVSIMSACCRASLLFFFFLGCFLQVQGDDVFRAPRAHSMFLRSKRGNNFLLEEILQGNLERECYEEKCNFEEAREYFEDTEKTISFWTVYYDGDQCEPNPCLHGGNCTDKVGGFHCSCDAPYYGHVCELGALADDESPPYSSETIRPVHATEVSKCLTEGPTACHQLCTATHWTVTCSCMPGFKLQTDGRSCLPEVEFPCGRLPQHANTTASMCRHGKCPWQVSLLNIRGVELCGGVALGRFSVLTAARCLFLDPGTDPRPSNFYVVTGDKMLLPVRAFYIHDRFRINLHDNDLTLLELDGALPFSTTLIHLCLPTKDFSENVLMHSGKIGVTKRWKDRRTQELVYITLDECRSQLNVSHPLSNKMFCMRRQRGRLGDRREAQERLAGPGVDQNRTKNSTAMPNGAGTSNSSTLQQHGPSADIGPRSGTSSRQCGGLLPGTPAASLDRGTAFLTGLLMSSSADCDGAVFAKLSRYLSWIKPRLEATEAHMTPQEMQYPEYR